MREVSNKRGIIWCHINGVEKRTKIRCLACQRNESLIPRIKEKRANGNAISENTLPAGGRPVEEEAKRERNRSDVTRARVEERRKEAKSPKTHSRSTKTQSVIIQIINIINNILKVGYFPQLWKTASVIPILKPGKDPTLPDSFRPISLLPVLRKITEKIIQKRLGQHLNDNDILIPQQHGFRAGLSTSHQLLRVVEYIKSGFQNRKSTGAVFLDIQKAFDRVWHVGLL
ncbi:RNA-directed DNA polymerase from mobile element jockey [Trichonephila clavipes]|nr:RNA-directed DNA polymerase from mobile element jockey [Trichonephila clavipes]